MAGRVAELVAAVHAATPALPVLFTGPGFERFVDAYEAAAGPCDINPELVAFFLLRRNLDDLTDWLGAVLEVNRPVPQRHADLDGTRWCLSRSA
jgi:hypothetical protein